MLLIIILSAFSILPSCNTISGAVKGAVEDVRSVIPGV